MLALATERPATWPERPDIQLDDEAADDVTPEHAGEIIAALAEQFGGTFATEDQLTTALSFMLGTLRATREKEARHE